jgi:AraC-like DNA-binding protein
MAPIYHADSYRLVADTSDVLRAEASCAPFICAVICAVSTWSGCRLSSYHGQKAKGVAATMIVNHISDRIINYVESNYAQAISLRDVALVMGYSPCHLTTVFRRATGTPITAWIVRRRIEAARQLLAAGTMSVAQACESVGFSDLCYFTRQFVRHVGITPGRFRTTTQTTARASSMARS